MAKAETRRLVADVGGTRARFGVSDEQGPVRDLREFKTSEFPNFVDCAKAYLARLNDSTARPRTAAIAVAGPLQDGVARLTNVPWTINAAEVEAAFGFSSVCLVNDFEAQAYALPWLGADDLEQVGEGATIPRANRVVLGPGTGLGVAGLVCDRLGELHAVPGEGGHTTLAAMSDEEAELIARLRRRFGHVSAERVVSGPGLEALYQAISHAEGDEASDAVSANNMASRAEAGDETAARTLQFFSSFFGTVAADLALVFWARGGVYLSGGVLQRLGPAFDKQTFRRRFESKGRFSATLANIPTFVVKHANAGLLGLTKMKTQ